MSEAPKRRWLRFSLRTLFVAMTLAAVLFGWFVLHGKWIADRQKAREWFEARGGFIVYAGDSFAMQSDDGAFVQSLDGGITSREGRLLTLPAAPWSLRVLGEKTSHFIILSSESRGNRPLNMAEVEAKLPELRRLFPECDIRVDFVNRSSTNNIKPLRQFSDTDLQLELRFWQSQTDKGDWFAQQGSVNHLRDVEWEIEARTKQ